MTNKQELVAFIGVFLIELTVYQHFRNELKVILFDAPTLQSLWTPDASGNKPRVNQYGQPDPNGEYSLQAPTKPGGPVTIIPNF